VSQPSPPGNPRPIDGNATKAGVFIGTIISFLISLLPETNTLKPLFIVLTPAITGAMAAAWSYIRNRMVEGSEDEYISSTTLETKKILLDKLNDPTLSDEEKAKAIQAISEINTLEIEAAVVRVRKAQAIIDRRKARKG
jgi:hypothetical protein